MRGIVATTTSSSDPSAPWPWPGIAPLFARSDGGAEHWAVIASLVETAKLNGIDPQAHLTDILIRIVEGHPNTLINELTPWAYTAKPTLSNVA